VPDDEHHPAGVLLPNQLGDGAGMLRHGALHADDLRRQVERARERGRGFARAGELGGEDHLRASRAPQGGEDLRALAARGRQGHVAAPGLLLGVTHEEDDGGRCTKGRWRCGKQRQRPQGDNRRPRETRAVRHYLWLSE
jgi:hypothetical protein